MSKSWLHPSRPTVPQPPFNLQPDVPQRSPRGQQFVIQRSELPYSPHMGAGGVPMQRSPAMAPPVPQLPAAYAQAPAPATTTPSAATSPTPGATTPLRRMTQEERTAYIQEIDRAHAALSASASALKPLQLASSATIAAPTTPPLPPTPPEDDEALRAYMDAHYNADRPAAADTPSDVGPEGTAQDATSVGAQTVAPGTPIRAASPPPTATYASTAHNVGTAHRVAATRIYSYAAKPQPIAQPAVAPGASEAGATAAGSSPATPAIVPQIVVPSGASVGGHPAVIEVLSNGQVVARITLPWPQYGGA